MTPTNLNADTQVQDAANNWWNPLGTDTKYELAAKHGLFTDFSSFPERFPEESILSIYLKEADNSGEDKQGEFMLLLNEGAEDEQKLSLAKYINAFDEDLEADFMWVINLMVGQSCQYGADHIKRIS